MSKAQEQYKDHFALLLEGGFIAVNHADDFAAKKLFSAARMLNPANALPDVGFGYLDMCMLNLTEAVTHFEEALKKDPENEMAKTFLGFTMTLMPKMQQQGEEMLKQLSDSDQGDVKNLSKDALSFLNKHIKPSSK